MIAHDCRAKQNYPSIKLNPKGIKAQVFNLRNACNSVN
jgi:hypothetical protein